MHPKATIVLIARLYTSGALKGSVSVCVLFAAAYAATYAVESRHCDTNQCMTQELCTPLARFSS